MIAIQEDRLFVIETEQLRGRTEERVQSLARQLPEVPENADLTITRAENGKPYFPRLQELCFSVTHSGRYWMCLFSARETGIDLQIHTGKNHAEKIAQRFFHPAEQAFLQQRGSGEFFSLWAAKESYVKYTGDGIAGRFPQFSVVEDGEWKKEIEGVPLRFLEEFPQYSCCVCGGTGGPVRIFFPESIR